MSYQPFEPRVLPLIAYYIGLSVFSIIVTARMGAKYKERRLLPPLLMAIAFGVFTAALTMLTAGLVDSAVKGYYMELYRFSLPFGYVMIVIADIVLYKFAIVITGRGQKAFSVILAFGAVLAVILFMPMNWWGYPAEAIGEQLNIRIISTLALIGYSYTVYGTIARVCRMAMADAKDPVAKTGLKLMFWSMVCLVLFFLMFVLDTLLIVMVDHPGYSEFVYVAWIFAGTFYVLMYLSVVMPDGFVRRLRKNT